MIARRTLIALVFALFAQHFVIAQDSVIGLLKNNRTQGNHYYEKHDYEKALKFYRLINPGKVDYQTELQIARCFYFLKNYAEAASTYAKLRSANALPTQDLIYYAELNTSLKRYPEAIQSYNEILSANPGDPETLQKIWQLTNVHLFYEDSMHYSVRRLPINTTYAELSPVIFDRGIVFLSDRKEIDFKNPEQESGGNDFNLFYSEIVRDSLIARERVSYRNPANVRRHFPAASGLGPVAFYSSGTKCVFSALDNTLASDGTAKMQLFFSEKNNGKWATPKSYEHNDKEHNFTEPSISPDGKTLFFVSDKPGGFGDYDIYTSNWNNDSWTTPENIGDGINTSAHESFPFLYYNTLYFSSDGHPGIGGMDIFSTLVSAGFSPEVKNLGYPLNSGGDDFGFILENGSRGFFSSNRLNGGYDDDLYEFEMDFRTYPFDIAGTIKIRERGVTDTVSNNAMADKTIELVDFARNQVIAVTQTDSDGKFSVSIPYFSKYVLRILNEEKETHIVSLEIDRESSKNSDYEIVVIKQSSNGFQKADIKSE